MDLSKAPLASDLLGIGCTKDSKIPRIFESSNNQKQRGLCLKDVMKIGLKIGNPKQ